MSVLRGLIAVAVGVAAMAGAPASAQPARARTVTFTSYFHDPGSRVTGMGGIDPSCRPGTLVIAGTAYFAKPLKTVDTYHGCVAYDPVAQLNWLTAHPQSPAFFSPGYTDDKQVGQLDGCGNGSFVMHQTNLRVTSVDAATQTWHLELDWSLKTGAGAFAGATGHGTGQGDFAPPSTSPVLGLPNVGSYRGSITCLHHN